MVPGCARKVDAGKTLGRGCVTVIGDAAHPTTPALGQVSPFHACANQNATDRLPIEYVMHADPTRRVLMSVIQGYHCLGSMPSPVSVLP